MIQENMDLYQSLTILLIGGSTVTVLIAIVIFLSWRLFRLKKRARDYEVMQSSQMIIQPKNSALNTKNNMKNMHMKNMHIPLSAKTNNTLEDSTLRTCDSSLSKGDSTISFGDSPAGSGIGNGKDFPHRELLSLVKLNDTGSSNMSGSEADLLPHINGKDDTESLKMHAPSKEVPAIDFKLVYGSQNLALKVHINRVSNLPVQFRKNCASYVKISLYANSEKLSSRHTTVIKKSLNPEYEEDFEFSGYNFEEIKAFTVRLSVYAKRKQLSKRQLVGDLFIPLSRPDFEPDTELICNERLSLACPRTGKRGPLMMIGELGFLFIQLQYQPEAERLKVFVRKGQNIANKSAHHSNFHLTQSEYYVIVSIMNGNDTVAYKESKTSVGSSPIWNQPFIFDIPEVDLHQYCLQFLVMKGKLYSKDGAVGQVLIGPNTSKSGIDHWNEINYPKYLETAKWHEITHIGTYCF